MQDECCVALGRVRPHGRCRLADCLGWLPTDSLSAMSLAFTVGASNASGCSFATSSSWSAASHPGTWRSWSADHRGSKTSSRNGHASPLLGSVYQDHQHLIVDRRRLACRAGPSLHRTVPRPGQAHLRSFEEPGSYKRIDEHGHQRQGQAHRPGREQVRAPACALARHITCACCSRAACSRSHGSATASHILNDVVSDYRRHGPASTRHHLSPVLSWWIQAEGAGH